MNQMKRRDFLKMAGATATVVAAGTLVGCGKKKKTKEELLVGDWYGRYDDEPVITFYKDSTYQMLGDYGLGKWLIVNDDMLRLVDFYGEVLMMKLINVDETKLELGMTDSDDTSILCHTPEEAAQYWK